MLNWIPCELHTHTRNSDGSFTVEELCHTAKEYKVQCIALTDHNTAAGCKDLTPELAKETVPAIKAIEWTTFFGHMVVLGADKYVDWRFATIDNIDEKLCEVKQAGGLAGVAHPFRVGSPICTGCHWDYKVTQWELVDYLEIWSELFPTVVKSNHRAIEMWTDLLDRGYHIAATYGKDWHGRDNSGKPDAATYLGINEKEEINPANAMEAIKNGRTFVSMAPSIAFTIKQNDSEYYSGDTIKCGSVTLNAKIDMILRKEIWGRHDIKLNKVQFVSNGGNILKEINLEQKDSQCCSVEMDTKDNTWMRAEILGSINGIDCTLAITSPIYIKR